MKNKLSTESYKGVRDFYPREQFIHTYMLNTLSGVCESFGYEQYNASILEPSELYKSKTSDEIVNDQTYTFTDRGNREVTLRPEMTPTVARMVAKKSRELSFPLRWYSTPNCFRYERTQRGRLREFWQLNADIFGVATIDADAEIIALAHALFLAFGANESDFEIRVNDRRVFETIFDELSFGDEERKKIMHLMDRKAKIDNFEQELSKIAGDKTEKLSSLLASAASNPMLENLVEKLGAQGVKNVIIDTSITRGFDYYTGMVFEIFDTAEENNRSLAGGGRYDSLMELFGTDTIPTVGFALGDVTMENFLETHNLLPEYSSSTDLMLCVLDESLSAYATKIAQSLRIEDVNVAVNYSYKKPGDQIKSADKKNIPFTICIGEKEKETGVLTIKNLKTGEESSMPANEIADFIFAQTE